MVWYFHLFENFPQFIVIHTVKGFGIVSKAEIDVFLELSCFFFLFLKIFLFLAALHGMWDLSFPTRDRTLTPYSGSTVLTTGPPGDSLSCLFDDPVDVGNLVSGSSAFSKTSLNI